MKLTFIFLLIACCWNVVPVKAAKKQCLKEEDSVHVIEDDQGNKTEVGIPASLITVLEQKKLSDVRPDYMEVPTFRSVVQQLFPHKDPLHILEIGPGRCQSALDLLQNETRQIHWDGVDVNCFEKEIEALK